VVRKKSDAEDTWVGVIELERRRERERKDFGVLLLEEEEEVEEVQEDVRLEKVVDIRSTVER
jgi:hypothetical protein